MQIEEIKANWKSDSKVKDADWDLDRESLKTAELHEKYLSILDDANQELRDSEIALKKEWHDCWKYYSGKGTKEIDDKKGGAFKLKLIKEQVKEHIEIDDDYLYKKGIVTVAERKVDYLQSVMEMIMKRDWQISNAIKFRIFMSKIPE